MSYSIKVCFTQEIDPDFVSRAIMWAEGTNYSHVMMIFEDMDGKEKILHSIGGGTCIDENCSYLTTHKIVRSFRVPMKVSQAEFCGYARGRVGREYSESQYLNQILRLCKIPWMPFKNGNAKGICSEEVAYAALLSALEVPQEGLSKVLDLMSPKMVDEFLTKNEKAQLLS